MLGFSHLLNSHSSRHLPLGNQCSKVAELMSLLQSLISLKGKNTERYQSKKSGPPPSTNDPVGIYGELGRDTWYIITQNLFPLKKRSRGISVKYIKTKLQSQNKGEKKEQILTQSQVWEQSNVISDSTGRAPHWLFMFLPK